MTTRGEINSNFYQIVNVDANGAPTSVKPEYITGGNVTNATHANVADVANSVAGSNVTGAVGLATYATTANSVAGANVSGQVSFAAVANSVAVANVSGIGNIAVINLDGNVSNILHGNGYWGPESGNLNANYANFAGTAFNVSGSNVTGTVGNATHATVSDSANSVSVGNVSGIGNIATINLTGSSSNVLYGNGVFASITATSANYANYAGEAFSVSAANIVGTINLANYATVANSVAGANVSGQVGYAAVANSVSVANVSGIGNIATVNLNGNGSQVLAGNGAWVNNETANANYANFAGTAFNVSGSNVTGAVANATYAVTAGTADSVAVANVSGIGNIATVNLTGSTSNVLYGNGVFAAIPTVSNVANANYANFAGEAFNVSGSNVSGAVNLANYATVANSVAGANVSGQVANANFAAFSNVANIANSVSVANVSGIGNIATINLDGNVSNVLSGTGTWISTGTAITANFANFAGNVTVSSQPNITSLGNVLEIQFNNTVTPVATPNIGEMFWDTGEHTVTLGMENGVKQQIGLESYIYVKASATITNGQVVMFTGANGNNVTAAPADATSGGFRPGYVLGIATQDIANNGFGYITVFGVVHGLNTNSYTVGDLLWLDPTTPGGLTATQPVAPNYQIQVATVVKKSAGDGHLQVIIRINDKLDNLSDVTLTSPVSGQALVLDGGNVWLNGYPAYANTANSVALANVVGIGNIASINLTGSTSNVLYGNGVFAAIPTISNVANANYANFAGEAFSVSAANIVGTVNLANYAAVANSVAGANVSGQVNYAAVANSVAGANVSGQVNYAAVANSVAGANVSGAVNLANYATVANSVAVGNVSGIGNIATINLTGSSSNVLYGNGVFAPASGGGSTPPGGSNTYVQFNDAGSFGGVANLTFDKSTNTLSATNITGNGAGLTSITGANVTGAVAYATTANSVAGANVSGQVSFAAVANSVAGANVSGTVANATYATSAGSASTATSATTAGTVTTNAQPNITSVGTLTSLSVSGNANIGNIGTGIVTATGNITGSILLSTVATGTAPFTVTSTTQVANLNVASAGLATYATTANSVAVANVSGIGNIATLNLNGNAQTVLVGNGAWQGPSIAQFSRTTGQTTGFTAGSAIVFNTTTYTIGSGITLNTSTGVITLAANRTYKLTGILNRIDATTNGGYCDFQWRNTTSNTLIGIMSSTLVVSNGSNAAVVGTAFAVITPSVSTDVKLEIQGSTALSQIGQYSQLPVALVEVIN